MNSLYNLSGEFGHLLHEIENMDGEIPPELTARLDAVESEFEAKIHACCCAMRNINSRAVGIQAEIERLSALEDAEMRRLDWLKEYIKEALERSGAKKIKTPLFTVWTQKNARPTIELATADTPIPSEFKKVREEFDKNAAYEAWKRGELMPPGVKVTEGSHLRVS